METKFVWSSKEKTPKNEKEKEFRTTKTTYKKSEDRFFTTHERKIRKVQNIYQRKVQEPHRNDDRHEVKFRSVTEPEPYSIQQVPK
jgi:hypothetical protein